MQGMELVRDLEKQGLELKAQNKGSDSSHNTAKYMFEFIYMYESRLPELNVAKGKLDEAHKVRDKEKFQEALYEFKKIVWDMTEAKKKFKARRSQQRLKIHSDLYHETFRKINFVERTIDGGKQWLKNFDKSPAQLEAARKASMRMRMAWGM